MPILNQARETGKPRLRNTFVRIHSTKPNDAEFARESKVISWSSPSDKKWLTNHMHWAMLNGVCVGLEPINDATTNTNQLV